MKTDCLYDIFVIGGGVNGCGIARDAAGRGFSVFLAEKNDLASGTSSASTKLIHGGLRYLEQYQFRLVRESLREREVLWSIAPHIIWPLRFILPCHKNIRPAWLLRLGLFLYDHIGGRKALPPTRELDLRLDGAGDVLKSDFVKAFEYSDCWVDDARLVVLNACDAANRGASIHVHTEVIAAVFKSGAWEVTVRDFISGGEKKIRSKIIVNATGCWMDLNLLKIFKEREDNNTRLIQGSHIVIKKKFEHDRAYIFQNKDKRIFFAIPYCDQFTLIGTTDREYSGDLEKIRVAGEEIDYLCSCASEYFSKPVAKEDIVWSYSGIRPLYGGGEGKAQEVTRDYVLQVKQIKDTARTKGGEDKGVLINVLGGKITTYRKLAEAALEKIEKFLGKRRREWTAYAPLPGGDFLASGFDDQVKKVKRCYPFLKEQHVRRLVRLYGTKVFVLLGDAKTQKDLGIVFHADLTEVEVRYLVEFEWAITAEDILWRRTKCGLNFPKKSIDVLNAFLKKINKKKFLSLQNKNIKMKNTKKN